MDRLLKSTPATISIVIRDADGVAVDATSLPTIAIVNGAGTAVTSGTSTKPDGTTGKYEFALTAANLATLDTHTATWSATVAGAARTITTRYEVVGGFLFDIADLRAFDADLADATKHTAAKIREARKGAEDRLEELCGLALRPRGTRVNLDGTGRASLVLPDMEPRTLLSASIDTGDGAVALTAAEIADVALYEAGVVIRTDGSVWDVGNRNVALHYEHGLLEAPEPVRRAAMQLARRTLVKTALPSDRVTTYSDAQGTYRLAVEGRDGPTGIPEVDAVIEQFGYDKPAIG